MTQDGKGWHGEHQRHKEVATRAQARKANNTPMVKQKKLKVGTKVKFNKNSERVKQILPFHMGYEDAIGEIVGMFHKGRNPDYTVDFGVHPILEGSRYQVVLEAKDMVIVSPPKKGYKHADAPTMEKVENFTKHLHGSGIDADWGIEETKSSIRAYNSYHAINEMGYYDRWVDFTVIFPKAAPMEDFKLQFGDSYGARKYMLDDYLGETIAYTLDELGYG